jgi:hypothetical protein
MQQICQPANRVRPAPATAIDPSPIRPPKITPAFTHRPELDSMFMNCFHQEMTNPTHFQFRPVSRSRVEKICVGRSSHGWTAAVLSLCLVLFTDGLAWSAERPPIDLWQLVPANAGLAVEVRGLTEHVKQIQQSDLARRIQQHSAWQQVLNGPEFKQLQAFDQGIRRATDHSLLDWMNTVLGREAVLAILAGDQQAGRAERARFVVLTRLKQREDLQGILDAWTKLYIRQEKRLEHRGQVYFSRLKENQPASTVYYAQIEDVVILSDRESALTAVLDMSKEGPAGPHLANLPRFQKTLQLLNSNAAIRIFIQPEIWKDQTGAPSQAGAQVRAGTPDQKPSDPGEDLVQQALWKCQAIGVGIRFESGIIAEVAILSDELANNAKWRKFVERTAGNPAFLAHVPRNALLAFGGRHDLAALSEWGLSQVPPDQLKQLKTVRQMVRGILMGRDLLDDILPQLPADFGGFIVPRDELDLKAAPIDGLIAVALPAKDLPENQPGKAPFRSALNNAAQTGFSMLAAFHNASGKDDAALEDEDQNGVAVHWISSLGPYQPAYALSQDYLLVASSPKLIRSFLKQSSTDTWAADSEMRKFRDACFADASQVLALHGRLAREFVTQQRDFFVQQLVSAHKLTPAEANKRLDRMLEWVQLSDVVVIATKFSPDHIKIVLGIAVEGTPEKR